MENVSEYMLYKEGLNQDQLKSFEKAEKCLMFIYFVFCIVIFFVLYTSLSLFNNILFTFILVLIIRSLCINETS